MTEACFNSKIAGAAGASEAHNERKWIEDHPEPKYIAEFAEHADPRGNEKGGQGLTRDQVRQEYIDHTEYGRRTGKVHNRVKLFREGVINCTEATEKVDVGQLVKTLEKKLNIRSMGWHLHRDEGHLDDETGKPKRNYHIHLAYTNLKDGQVTHMDKTRMKRAQDICAEALNMPRGKPHKETGRVSMDHKQYRQHARQLAAEKRKTRTAKERAERAEAKNETLETALGGERQARQGVKIRADQAEKDRDWYKAEYEALGKLNKEIREQLRATEAARKADYQAWKKELNDKEKTFEQKETAGQELVATLRNRAEAAELERDKEEDRADRAESQPQMIMGAVPFRMGKIKLPQAGIVQRAGSYREKAQAHVDRALQDRKHQIQQIAEDAARNEVAAELNQAQRDNENAAAHNKALASELETEKLNTEAVKIDLQNTQETNRTLANQVTVMKDEKEKLDTEHTKLQEIYKSMWDVFEPLTKLMRKLYKAGHSTDNWLEDIVKEAEKLANKLLKPAPSRDRGADYDFER